MNGFPHHSSSSASYGMEIGAEKTKLTIVTSAIRSTLVDKY